MAKDLEKTLSDKIEDTIEGVLRFAVRFARTVAVILATPWKCDRILLEADRRDKRFVRPLTFLAIGGFVFSVTISVYPKGLLGLINIIWFSDEISAVILSRWQEALSVTGLLIAAFPVLLTVTSVAALAGQTFRSEKRRSEFLSLNCYLFGYQYFLFFSFFFFAILQGILGELVGVEVKEVLGFEKLTFNDTLFAVLVAALVVLFLSALLMPTVGLCLWAVRTVRFRAIWLKAAACLSTALYAFAVLALCSYTASAPAAFKHVAAPRPDEIKIHLLGDPVVKIPAGRSAEDKSAHFVLHIAIENIPTAHLIARRDELVVGIVAETKGKPDTLWSSGDFMIKADGRNMNRVMIAKGGIAAYELTGTVELPQGAIALIRQKAERPLESNDFSFFVNIRLRRSGKDADRRLYLDAEKMLAP